MFIRTSKRGGIRFIRVGRVQASVCIARTRAHEPTLGAAMYGAMLLAPLAGAWLAQWFGG